ncbi:unnamed protein product, partial [Callosobruchus maculatus]
SRWAKFKRRLQIFCILNPDDKKGLEFFGSASAMRIEQRRQAKGYDMVIHPFSKMNYFMEGLFFVSWLVQLIALPLNLCVFTNSPDVF